MKTKTARRKNKGPILPPVTDWRTTDAHEILKRQLRAREERYRITNLDPGHPVFSNFEVQSPSGMTYQVEIRDRVSRQFSCTCIDFRINDLGTCKHIEAILLQLARRHRAEYKAAKRVSSTRVDIVPDRMVDRLRVERGPKSLPPALRAWFGSDGFQLPNADPADIAKKLAACRSQTLRVSQDHQRHSLRRLSQAIAMRPGSPLENAHPARRRPRTGRWSSPSP